VSIEPREFEDRRSDHGAGGDDVHQRQSRRSRALDCACADCRVAAGAAGKPAAGVGRGDVAGGVRDQRPCGSGNGRLVAAVVVGGVEGGVRMRFDRGDVMSLGVPKACVRGGERKTAGERGVPRPIRGIDARRSVVAGPFICNPLGVELASAPRGGRRDSPCVLCIARCGAAGGKSPKVRAGNWPGTGSRRGVLSRQVVLKARPAGRCPTAALNCEQAPGFSTSIFHRMPIPHREVSPVRAVVNGRMFSCAASVTGPLD
jgi:hypothetical protein